MSTPKDLTTPAARTAALREWMYTHAIDAFIVPTADPHDSEYLPDRWKTREWLTGFTGSAGLALLTADEGWLWTDSRYFLQAAEQLRPTPYRLMRDGEPDTPTLAEVLGTLCGKSAANRTFTVSFVAETMPVKLLGELQQALAGKGSACRL
ncbi:MAG: aminopeptidase P family N-terminal domain-containing protein, partial [Alloprevotella sp.]